MLSYEFSNNQDDGLSHLLDLDGNIEVQNEEGYWVKMEVSRVDVTAERPHGIRYSLTLHAPTSERLMGFDNAHGGFKPEGSRFNMLATDTLMTIDIDIQKMRVCCMNLTRRISCSVTFMLRLIAF